MRLSSFEDQAFFLTARITASLKSGASSVGTGFLLNLKINDKKRALLLISNKHVLKDSNELYLSFNKKHPRFRQPILGQILKYKFTDYDNNYYEHAELDLACFNVSFLGNQSDDKPFYKTIPEDFNVEFKVKDLVAGSSILFVGYPEGRYDQVNNLPILRSGTIASIPKVDFNDSPEFLIDAHVYPGSSGSPVFTIQNGKARFIGILAAGMIKDNKLQTIDTAKTVGVQQTIGVGIVIKSSQLEKLLKIVRKDLVSKI